MPRRERKKKRIDPKHRVVIMSEGYCICSSCGTKTKTEVDCHQVSCKGCGKPMTNNLNYRGGKYV